MKYYNNLNWKTLTHDAWSSALSSPDYNVTGTLKFNDGRCIGQATAGKLLGAYWHKLDRIFFGSAAKKGVGVERWVFTEYGELGDNLHFHFMAKSPTEPMFFCAVANTLWSNFNAQTASAKYNEITPTIDPQKSARYVTKGTKNFNFDAIGFKASHRNTAQVNMDDFQNEGQAKRILNHLTQRQILQAMELATHQAEEAQRRMKIRHLKTEALSVQ